MSEIYGFEPTHPGEVLKDEIEYRGLSQKELATKMGISYTILNDILNKREKTAMLFEAAMDVPAYSLMNLQYKYNRQTARKDLSFLERFSNIRKVAAML